MKWFFVFVVTVMTSGAFANGWTYQVNINNDKGAQKRIENGKASFEAGPYYCEVTPVTVSNNTEYRSLVCTAGSGTVGTGALCTRKGAKFPSVQYAILNLTGPKNVVNVTVACHFD